jgi:hypothetical protein
MESQETIGMQTILLGWKEVLVENLKVILIFNSRELV